MHRQITDFDIERIHKQITRSLVNMPQSKNSINYYPMKYHNFLSEKFVNILNDDNNNVYKYLLKCIVI